MITNFDKRPNTTSYAVIITDPYGRELRILDEYVSLEYSRRVNQVGQLALLLKDEEGSTIFKPENRIEVWRTKYDGTSNLDMETTWFIHTIERFIQEDGTRFIHVFAHDTIGLLGRRIIPYNEGNPTTQKQDTADNVIKEIVRENLGSLATDTSRDLSTYLTIEGDTSYCPQVTVFIAKENVFSVLQDIAKTSNERGTFLAFDIAYYPDSATFNFKTFPNQRGIDRTEGPQEITLSVEAGSINSIRKIDAREEEKNYVYAGAKDLVGIVPPQTASDSDSVLLSPFNRKELFLNASSADDADELQVEADSALQENKHRIRIEASLAQEYILQKYGEEIKYGDIVKVSFDNEEYTLMVDSVTISVSSGVPGEQIDVVLLDPNTADVDPVDVWPFVRVYRDTNEDTDTNTPEIIEFTDEVFDDANMWSATNPTRLTCKVSGYYMISANVLWEADADGDRQMFILLNGLTVIAGDLVEANETLEVKVAHSMLTMYYLVAGEYVELRVNQTSGNTIAAEYAAERSVYFEAARIG